VPAGAKVFVFAGGNAHSVDGSFWMEQLRRQDDELVSSWEVRTFLTELEAKQWGELAAAADPADGAAPSVWVVCFSDGSIDSVPDPSTGELGFSDWSFDVIKKAGYLLSHGAPFVITAEDSFNVRPDGWPLPGPGMIAAMFRTLLYPRRSAQLHVCGKGGDMGDTYMMKHAIGMLQAQGHSGRREEILMVGDRFDTDVRAGTIAGIKTCLVESGCDSVDLRRYFPQERLDYVASSVADLVIKRATN